MREAKLVFAVVKIKRRLAKILRRYGEYKFGRDRTRIREVLSFGTMVYIDN